MSKNLILYGYSGFNNDQRTLMENIEINLEDPAIILMEDGVVGVNKTNISSPYAKLLEKGAKLYCLSEDYNARGLNPESIVDGINTIDYAGLIALIDVSEKVISWL